MKGFSAALLVCVSLAAADPAAAQQLAVRWYGTQDGLASANITSVLQDSRGYLWLSTLDGVSRFDGTSFLNYSAPDDLPDPIVWTVAEDPAGRIWLGTNGEGLVRLEPGGPRGSNRIRTYRLTAGPAGNAVDAIAFDGRGRLWCISDAGLFRADSAREPLAFERIVASDGPTSRDDAYVQQPDHLWFAMGRQLIEVRGDRVVRHALPAAFQNQNVTAVRGRPDGSVVAAAGDDVLDLTTAGGADHWRAHGLRLTGDEIEALAVAPDGSVWIGTTRVLIHESAGAVQRFDRLSGIPAAVTSLCQDRSGRLWIGTRLGGVGRLSSDRVIAFTPAQGLPDRIVSRVMEGRDGSIVATTTSGVVAIRHDRVEPLPQGNTEPFRSIGRRLAVDRFGNWWAGTSAGLFFVRGPVLDFRRAIHLGPTLGLPVGNVFDGPGMRVIDDTLYVVVDQTLYAAPLKNDAPAPFHLVADMHQRPPVDLSGDSSGRLWLATFFGLVWKSPGRAASAPQPLDARTFMRDATGALWVGTRIHGIAITTDPAAPAPAYRRLTTHDGLSSDTVWSFARTDRFVYVGTGRGVDRYDRQSGAIENLSAIDGLAPSEVYQVIVDSRQRVWAATANGVLRFDPPIAPQPLQPPAVYVVGLRLNGSDVVPAPGARQLTAPPLSSPRSDIAIEFGSVDVDRPEPVSFEYRVDPLQREWSRRSTQRVVSYPRLPPGHFTFQVRSVTREGTGPIASVTLEVSPALWQRWWFVALALGAIVAVALAFQRARLGRLIALERVRRQIASDLHDDLGSGLAQIAVLAEVAQRDRSGRAAAVMTDVAGIARDLRASVGDIVWAVDPRHDQLADAVSRMREQALSILEPLGIAARFDADIPANIYLAPDRRRHLTLLVKEALTNIARHAAARQVTIVVHAASGRLVIDIADDGRGFDPASVARGRGLDNLEARARALGGTASVDAAPGRGTWIRVTVRL